MSDIVILSREPKGTWNLGESINFSGAYGNQSVVVSMLIGEWVKLTDAYRYDQGQIMNWLEYHATQEAMSKGRAGGGLEIKLSF